MLQFAAVLAQTEESLAPLIMPPLGFAAVAVGTFLALALVSWSFRDVANRHSEKWAEPGTDSHGSGH